MSKRILVVDDDEDVRKAFMLALESEGYLVETVDSGEKAIESVKQTKIDLIFIDLNMPGIGGVTTVREIRKLEPHVPIYIVTAYHQRFFEDLKKAVNEGISFELLAKPMTRDHIYLVTKGAVGPGI
jgi:CheY-like chemotaxis protein